MERAGDEESGPAPSPLQRGALVVLIWSGLALAQSTAQLVGARSASIATPPLGFHLWSRESIALAWAAFTPLVFLLLKRVPLRSWRALGPHLAAAFVTPPAVLVVAYLLFNLGLGTLFDPALPVMSELKGTIVLYYGMELLTYAELLAVAWAIEAARRAGAEELRRSRLASELVKARVASLKTQLQPHFLFNSLNMLMPLIAVRPDEAERLLVQLGELFRVSLNASETLWPVRSELDFVSRYLDIQRARFGPRLSAEVRCEPGVEDAAVPPLVLQPLVENAIAHGITPRPGSGRLVVRASRAEDGLLLEVVDDGLGLSRPRRVRPGTGVGLANTRTRLFHLFGEGERLSVTDRAEGGVLARIDIPFIRIVEPAA